MRRFRCPCLLLICSVSFSGCAASSDFVRSMRGVMPLSRDIEVTRAEILKRVPIGTPIEEAKLTLRAHDFWPNWEDKEARTPAGQELTFSRYLPQREWGDFYPGLIYVYLTQDGSTVTGVRVEKRPG